jgi:hypothetical protein
MVLAAVEQNGLALEWASDARKNDYDIVLAAVRQDGKALRWASEPLKTNRELIFVASEW